MSIRDAFESQLGQINLFIGAAVEQEDVGKLGGPCQQISRLYRGLAISQLLLEADTHAFFHGLIQSGLTWMHFLERARAAGETSAPAWKASFVAPFLDAVAADQWPLARRIAELAPSEWRPEAEYEDDWAYARFLYGFVAGADEERASLESLLERWEAALEGGDDARLDLARALLEGDQEAFDDSIETLLAEREAWVEENADAAIAVELDYDVEPNLWVCVEVLALLRLGESVGLSAEDEYLYCPSIARRAVYRPFVVGSFPGLPLPG